MLKSSARRYLFNFRKESPVSAVPTSSDTSKSYVPIKCTYKWIKKRLFFNKENKFRLKRKHFHLVAYIFSYDGTSWPRFIPYFPFPTALFRVLQPALREPSHLHHSVWLFEPLCASLICLAGRKLLVRIRIRSEPTAPRPESGYKSVRVVD